MLIIRDTQLPISNTIVEEGNTEASESIHSSTLDTELELSIDGGYITLFLLVNLFADSA